MKILRTGDRECFNDLPLEINWHITSKCNYRCSYCFDFGKNAPPPPEVPFATLEQLRTAVNNIASLNRPSYDIVFSGGEPTIHPHLFEVISMLHESLGERINKITIITNGSRNDSLYKGIADMAKDIPFILRISIHTDHVKMDHILNLIKKLSNDVYMFFSLMFNPDKREFVHEIYGIMSEYSKQFPFNMEVGMLRHKGHVDTRYTPADFAWQKEANARFNEIKKSVKLPVPQVKKVSRRKFFFADIEDDGELKTIDNVNYSLKYTNGLINFQGMYCIANAALIDIGPNGRCRGMVCSDDTVAKSKIYDKDNFKSVRDKFIHAVRCTRPLCGCGANYCIPKFASEQEAKKYVEFAQKRQVELFAEYDAAQLLKTI